MTRARKVPALAALLVPVALVLYPLLVPRFWILSIASQAIILGIVALSLVFMAGQGGMVSLAQAALAGLAAYMTAILTLRLGLPALPAGLIAVLIATLVGALFGAIASRSQGIYFLMLTLALAVGFFYLALQNYDLFGGHIGFAGVLGPTGSPRENPAAFYYLCLATAVAAYLSLRYLARAPLGLSFQGIRDNPRRMWALGYWVSLHRVAIFAIGGLVAGLSGVLGIWYRGSISPGTVDLTRTIDVLIIAVVGGLGHPIGAFVGALFFVLVQTFASSVVVLGFSFDERFNTLIGLSFLLVVLFAPDGLIGLAARARVLIGRRLADRRRDPGPPVVRPVPEPVPVDAGADPPSTPTQPLDRS